MKIVIDWVSCVQLTQETQYIANVKNNFDFRTGDETFIGYCPQLLPVATHKSEKLGR